MPWLRRLNSNSTNRDELEKYILIAFPEISDGFNQNFFSLSLTEFTFIKDRIKDYITSNIRIIRQLNTSNKANMSYIALLLDVSENLALLMEFQILYKFLIRNDSFVLGKRLQAASLYLINIKKACDYLDRYEKIINLLFSAYYEEQDNEKKIIATLSNYYAEVYNNFGQFNIDCINSIKIKINETLSDSKFSFINTDIVRAIIQVNQKNYSIAYRLIKDKIQEFLGKIETKALPELNTKIIENSGDYYKKIISINPKEISFFKIREHSIKFPREILEGGTKPLNKIEQLNAYMYWFGPMHYYKLKEAISKLPKDFFNKKIKLIDWGCGQAFASITFLEYLNSNKIKQNISQLVLIEPSCLALKRASLHVEAFKIVNEIITLNKDFDSLEKLDLENDSRISKLHVFSNVLDIDNSLGTYYFSKEKLLSLISNSLYGENYFVCVSPNINDYRTRSLDSFVDYFKNKYPNTFQEILNPPIYEKAGEWNIVFNGIKKDWTRVVRIFKVTF